MELSQPFSGEVIHKIIISQLLNC